MCTFLLVTTLHRVIIVMQLKQNIGLNVTLNILANNNDSTQTLDVETLGVECQPQSC